MDESIILELTYFDKATISGKVKYKKPNGATAFKNDIKVKDIKCAISKKDLPVGTQTDTTNNFNYKEVMFCNPEVNVNPGDSIEIILESGTKKHYISGEPFYYSSHLEVPLIATKKA